MERLAQIEQRMAEIRGLLDNPESDLDALGREVNALSAERAVLNGTIERRQAQVNEVLNGNHPITRTFPGAGETDEAPRASEPARRIIEQAEKRGLLTDSSAALAERLVVTGEIESRSLASRWVQTTGDDHYLRAFLKVMGDPTKGHQLWTDQERQAYSRVQQVKMELRGMTTGTGYGGELLPLYLDPAIILTSEGSTNPLRRIAKVVTIPTKEWEGVSSAGVTAEWKSETAEVGDNTPSLGQPTIPAHFGSAFIPYSYEFDMDTLQGTQQLAALLTDAADQLQAEAFTNGVGTTEPKGFVTALAGTASVIPALSPEAELFLAEDVYALQNALPPRFQPRAQWAAALATINTMAQFETANGARLFPEIADGKLLRRALNECSNMQSTDDIDEGATEDNLILCYGDWSNFVIVDRIGSTIELIPQVLGENHRPTGQRGAFLWFRTGSDVVAPEAFRSLNVATSAVS